MGQMIAACGQNGDLYLPKPEPAQQTTAGTGTRTARQAGADGKAAAKAESAATSGIRQPGSEPARQTTAGAEANADAVRRVATEDGSAVEAGPAAASGVKQPEQQ